MTERAIENLSDAIAEQIAATLTTLAQERLDFSARVQELESQGRRIINGGQIDRNRWEYTDWRTGEVLAKGRCKDHDKFKMPDNWCHTDAVSNETYRGAPALVDGLPESLAETIIDWTNDHEAAARGLVALIAAARPFERSKRHARSQPHKTSRQ